MPEDLFPRALAVIFGLEGGYSSDPTDHGGPTNFGITQATYDSYRATLKIPTQPVAQITRDEATAIYRTDFWDANGCGEMTWSLALVVFDTYIQHRSGPARLMVHDVQWADEPEVMLAFALLCLRRNFYRRIIIADVTQSKYLAGWLNRLEKLRQNLGAVS